MLKAKHIQNILQKICLKNPAKAIFQRIDL